MACTKVCGILLKKKQHFSGDFFSGKSLKRTLCTEKTALSSSSPDSRRNVSRKVQRGQKKTEERLGKSTQFQLFRLLCWSLGKAELGENAELAFYGP